MIIIVIVIIVIIIVIVIIVIVKVKVIYIIHLVDIDNKPTQIIARIIMIMRIAIRTAIIIGGRGGGGRPRARVRGRIHTMSEYIQITHREVLSPRLLLGIGASKTILRAGARAGAGAYIMIDTNDTTTTNTSNSTCYYHYC